MAKGDHKKGLKDCLCGCGKTFIPRAKNHHFFSNQCRWKYWNPIRRDLNKCIKRLDQVISVTADLGRVTVDLAQFTVDLDKRIKALEGLVSGISMETRRQERQYQAHLKYDHKK